MASGSEVCKHGKVPKANTNLFYFISLRASLEPGSTLVGKGEKNHVGEKKKESTSEASWEVVWGGERVGSTTWLTSIAYIFPIWTRFFPFSPNVEPGLKLI